MKKNLNLKETVLISSMLFGMFFGAGNLIFPASLGISAGSNLIYAYLGMLITAVGMPMLAVVALGNTRSYGVQKLAGKVSGGYGVFFSLLLYLTIGPLFAIPRCASTSFSIGAVKLIGNLNQTVALAVFSFVFFVITLFFALRPGKIMVWIGKILNPAFLVVLAILVIAAIINPAEKLENVVPGTKYIENTGAFLNGFLEGYNTLDALAGLAFGIVVINVVKKQGVEEPGRIAINTAKAGIISCAFMGVIYFFITYISAQSAPFCADCANGGEILGAIADYYFGKVGAVLMTAIVTVACLKTAVGLVTSCSETFVNMFPKGPGYTFWAVTFCIVSFGIANFGLSTIVAYCVPVLMFLYPLAITLILLAIGEKLFGGKREVYVTTTAFTLVAAIFDFAGTLASTLKGSGVENTAFLDGITSFGAKILPFSELGLGWLCPAVIGFIIGLIISKVRKAK